jgi:hypothetical protein
MEIVLVVLVLISLGGSGFAIWQQLQLQKKYGQFLKGAEAKQVEELIKSYGGEVKESLSKIDELAGFVAKLHKAQQFAVSKMALIRFNPFGDTGGDQSFCLALLDHHDDGLVISAVHARSGTRVYAKDINAGESKHHLSDEEKSALKEALGQDIK